MIPPVSVEELRDAWPRFLAQTEQPLRRKQEPPEPLPLPLGIRCAIMREFLKGGEPTELMLAIIAQMPVGGDRVKEEMQRRLPL